MTVLLFPTASAKKPKISDPESEEFDPLLSSGDDRGEILVEDDGEDSGGKSGVGEVIHRPPKNLSLLNYDGGMGR